MRLERHSSTHFFQQLDFTFAVPCPTRPLWGRCASTPWTWVSERRDSKARRKRGTDEKCMGDQCDQSCFKDFHEFSWCIWSSRTVPSHLEPFAELQFDYLILQYPQISLTVLVFVEICWPEMTKRAVHLSFTLVTWMLIVSYALYDSMRCVFSLCGGLRWLAIVRWEQAGTSMMSAWIFTRQDLTVLRRYELVNIARAGGSDQIIFYQALQWI